MSQRFEVRAVLVKGQPFYCRAGRGWTEGWTQIEVLDQDEDPTLPNKVKNLPDVPDPTRLGRKSFAILSADARIVVKPVDGTSAEAIKLPALESRIADIEAQLGATKKALDDSNLRALVAEQMRDQKTAKITEMEGQLATCVARAEAAEGKLEELSAERADAVIKCANAETALAKLTQERDELASQLEQLTAPPATGEAHVAASKKVKPAKG